MGEPPETGNAPPLNTAGATGAAANSPVPPAAPARTPNLVARVAAALDNRFAKWSNAVKFVAAAASAALSLVLLLFVFQPDWDPRGSDESPPVSGFVVDPVLEHNVTLGEGCEQRQWPCAAFTTDQYSTNGVLVNFGMSTSGLEGQVVEAKWELISADTGQEVSAQPDQPGWPRGEFVIEAPKDSARGDIWVPYPHQDGRYYVRITLRNEIGTELGHVESGAFAVPYTPTLAEGERHAA